MFGEDTTKFALFHFFFFDFIPLFLYAKRIFHLNVCTSKAGMIRLDNRAKLKISSHLMNKMSKNICMNVICIDGITLHHFVPHRQHYKILKNGLSVKLSRIHLWFTAFEMV